jgi:hypothetical protein
MWSLICFATHPDFKFKFGGPGHTAYQNEPRETLPSSQQNETVKLLRSPPVDSDAESRVS